MTIEIDVQLFLDLASGTVLVEHDNRTAERVAVTDLITAEVRRVINEPQEIAHTLAGLRQLAGMLSHTTRQLEAVQAARPVANVA